MKPLILITNDDGIFSPGLMAVAEAAKHLGDILIAAPDRNMPAMSQSRPKGKTVGAIRQVSLKIEGEACKGYAIRSSPALAAAHAILELAPRRPDLCISGINLGENIGKIGTFVSGTVGAVLEASAYGVPGLAMSANATEKTKDWSAAKYFTGYFAEWILKNGLPKGVCALNVNLPAGATRKTPIRMTRQSMQNYYFFEKPKSRDLSKPFELQSEIKIDVARLEHDSDIKAFVDGVVSVTPLTQDMTARTALNKREWEARV